MEPVSLERTFRVKCTFCGNLHLAPFEGNVINSSRNCLLYLGSCVIILWGEKVLHGIKLFIEINIHDIYLAMH